jgi:hypothetical protein
MNAPLPFQAFQFALARHLRSPRNAGRPAGVVPRRAGIYRELVRNNLEGFLLACFPVTRTLLGPRRWQRLVSAFFRDARCHTPYFREIPREFLGWLLATDAPPIALPPWMGELAHYEWAELAVDVMETAAPQDYAAAGDLLSDRPVLAPALMNLAYAWPVHRIGRDWRPRKPSATHLLVFRDAHEAVQFIELNPLSAQLVVLLQAADGQLGGRDACLQIANELQHPEPELLLVHGAQLLNQLRTAGAILGSRK